MAYVSLRAPRSQFGLRGVTAQGAAAMPNGLRGEYLGRDGADQKKKMLMLAAAGGIALIALFAYFSSGTKEEATPMVFGNASECISSRKIPSGVCEAQWRKAAAEHQANAPLFADIKACEKQHGPNRCVKVGGADPARAEKYMPGMAGYFFGGGRTAKYQGAPLHYVLTGNSGAYRVTEAAPKTADSEPATASGPFNFLNPAAASNGQKPARESAPNSKAVPAAESPKLQTPR